MDRSLTQKKSGITLLEKITNSSYPGAVHCAQKSDLKKAKWKWLKINGIKITTQWMEIEVDYKNVKLRNSVGGHYYYSVYHYITISLLFIFVINKDF